MQNQIEILSEAPTCPYLRTLFVNHNEEFKMIIDGFFQFMPSLKVLNMSRGRLIQKLPLGISNLVLLQLLDVSETNIKELLGKLKAFVNLKCVNLEWARDLVTIPRSNI